MMRSTFNPEQEEDTHNDTPDVQRLLSSAAAKLNALLSNPSDLDRSENNALLNEAYQAVLAAREQVKEDRTTGGSFSDAEGQRILDALMKYIPEGITIAEAPDGTIRMVSTYGLELTGRPRESLEGIPIQEHPEYWQVYHLDGVNLVPAESLPLSRAILRGEIIENEELLLKRGSGEWIHISCNAGPIRDEWGEIVGGVIAWRDITKLKHTENALVERIASLTLLSEIAREFLRGEDPAVLLEEVYHRLAALLGLDAYVHYKIAPEEDQLELATFHGFPEQLCPALKRLKVGQGVCGTVAQTRQAMVVEDVQASSDPLTDLIRSLGITAYACHPLIIQDRLVGTLSFGSRRRAYFDTSALNVMRTVSSLVADAIYRKRVEAALRASEDQFRRLADSMPQLVWTANPDGSVDYYNQRVNDFQGFQYHADGSWQWQFALHPEDLQLTETAWRQSIQSGEIYQVEHRARMEDGRFRWHLSRAIPIRDDSGRIQKWYGTSTDIHETKLTEESLASANAALTTLSETLEERVQERTQELTELQSRFMDRIETERNQLAHEIHDGPMQDIYALVYHLSALNPHLPAEQVKAELQAIKREILEVNQALRVISQDLLPPMLSHFGLKKSIERHIANIQKVNPDLRIHIELQQEGKLPDERILLALYRIYQTSITNVIRHAQAKQVNIHFTSEVDHYHLVVQDDGKGFKLPGNWVVLARKGHMGLVSARERAQSVGGTFEVQSEPGQGTLVRVRVPISQENI
jgi:PAS domain S-box-containing protein